MIRLALIALLAMGALPAHADDAALLEAVRAADVRLATIGFRLSTAAAPLCDRQEPGLGMQVHFLAQYDAAARPGVKAHFRFAGPAAVEGVIADSPAARAGIEQDDTLVMVGPVAITDPVGTEATTAPLTALHQQLAALPPRAPVEVLATRAGREQRFTVKPVPACRTRYELRIANTYDARANGELVQISSKYLDEIDPELLPAVVAHELAHNILGHRERLKAVGADFGLASGFGRNVGYFRQTELQADILSVHLLARAGYPPQLAARFWREAGGKVMAGMIRSRSHPATRDRIATLEAEAARIRVPGAGLPAFYEARHRSLDGNWAALLVRSRP